MRQHCANLKKAKIGEINKDKMRSLIEVQKKIIMLQKNKDELTERLPELKYPLSDIIQGMNKHIPKFIIIDLLLTT